jgi:hypothetical protein
VIALGSRHHNRTAFLERHGKQIRVVVSVPLVLREIVGKAKLKRNLGRVTWEEAKAMRWPVVHELRAEMAALAHRKPMRRMEEITDYDMLIGALRSRRISLGIPQLEMDYQAGMQAGYTGKLEAKMKGLGGKSLGQLLKALKVRLVLEGAAVQGKPRGSGRTQSPARSTGAPVAGSPARRLPPGGDALKPGATLPRTVARS